MKHPTQHPDHANSWSIEEALAVSLDAFIHHCTETALLESFKALTRDRKGTLIRHSMLKKDIDKMIPFAITSGPAELVHLHAAAHKDADVALLFMHMGVRWWLARQDMLRQAPGTRIRRIHIEGLTDHESLQLLNQMLYQGACPRRT